MEVKCSIYKAFINDLDEKCPSINYMFKTFSYKHVLKKIHQTAFFLKQLGYGNDSVITICLPNIPSALYLLYAVNQIGGICNIVHPLMKYGQLKDVLEKTKSKVLFCLDTSYGEFKKFEDDGIVVITCSPCYELPFYKKWVYERKNREKLKYKSKYKFEDIPLQEYLEYENDYMKDSIYLHSGGTTGIPKTIALSSFAINSLASQANYILNGDNFKNKCMLACLPMFHGFGLVMGIHICQFNNACSTLMPKFSSKMTIKYIKKGMINYIIGIPILYEALLANKHFKGKKLQNIEVGFVGGDNVTESLIKRFNQKMKESSSNGVLYQGYGLTEFASVTNVNIFTNHKDNSVGKPLLCVKEKIVDIKTKKDLPCNQEGEIYILGDSMMNGYRFSSSDGFVIDENNVKWVNTGDYGYLDEEGYLFFKQRIKSIVKVNGINVFPSEVENIVMNNFPFKECACVSKPSKKRGQILDLYIVSDKKVADESIKNVIKDKCGVYSIPDKIYYVEKIDKTIIGKIDYEKLRKNN